EHITTINWPCGREPTTGNIEFDPQAVLQYTNPQATRQPWSEITPQRRSPQQDNVRRHCAAQLNEGCQVQFQVHLRKEGIVDRVDPIAPSLQRLLRSAP